MADYTIGPINEGDHHLYQVTWQNSAGEPILLASVAGLTLTLYDVATDAILNGRNVQSVLNANGGTFHATLGQFVITFQPADLAIQIDTLVIERHRALFVLTTTNGLVKHRVVDLLVRNLHLVP